jgi:hypothetical protein
MTAFKLFQPGSSMSASAHTDKQPLSDSKGGFISALMRRNSKKGGTLKTDSAVQPLAGEPGSELPVPSALPPYPVAHEMTGSLAGAALDSLINFTQYGTLKSAFDRFDIDDDGFLSADEVASALKLVGVSFSPEQVAAFIRLGNVSEERADAGTLSEEEFLALARQHRRSAKRQTENSRPAWDSDFADAGGWNYKPDGGAKAHPPRSGGAARNASPRSTPAESNGNGVKPGRPTTTHNNNRSAPPAQRRPPVPPARRTKVDRTAGPDYQDLHKKATYQSRAAAAGMTASRMAVGVDLEKRLEDVIGLEPIKEKLRALKDTLVKRRFRKEVGAPLVDIGPLHMIFTGNPGCGKTSIARLLAKLLYDLGAVSGPKFVEVQRTDLVGSHIGTTGPKTRAKIDEAKGGILFIDEAYRLTSTSEKDFGTEALEEIMGDMTTGDPLIIAAGYPGDMKRFLDANEGLKRRFGFSFDFPDFSVEEMAKMFILKVTSQGFQLGEGITCESVGALIEGATTPEWRSKINGGVAEKLARGAMQAQDARLSPTELGMAEFKAKASTIEWGDVSQASKLLKHA